MANQIVASDVQVFGTHQAADDGRARFVAPVVEDMGRLQALTQLLQVTVTP